MEYTGGRDVVYATTINTGTPVEVQKKIPIGLQADGPNYLLYLPPGFEMFEDFGICIDVNTLSYQFGRVRTARQHHSNDVACINGVIYMPYKLVQMPPNKFGPIHECEAMYGCNVLNAKDDRYEDGFLQDRFFVNRREFDLCNTKNSYLKKVS